MAIVRKENAITSLRLERLGKRFPGDVVAVQDLNLEAASGEYVVLVGPSACGKTTTLRLVAGLEAPTTGKVILDEQDATNLEPHRRQIAFVFQDTALYPHLNVEDNLAFGLKLQHLARPERRDRVRRIAKRLSLTSLLHRMPNALSGGQQRRVALGRALVRQPRYLLLDEPLSGLDPSARGELRSELARLHREQPTTTLHVTHDQEEALALGQRVAVLREGKLQQIDTPLSLYHRPINRFVAEFIGTPPMNVFPWTHEGRPCLVGIRPRDVRLGSLEGADLDAVIESVEWLGHETHVRLYRQTNDPIRLTVVCDRTEAMPGQRVGLHFLPEKLHHFDAQTGLGTLTK